MLLEAKAELALGPRRPKLAEFVDEPDELEAEVAPLPPLAAEERVLVCA